MTMTTDPTTHALVDDDDDAIAHLSKSLETSRAARARDLEKQKEEHKKLTGDVVELLPTLPPEHLEAILSFADKGFVLTPPDSALQQQITEAEEEIERLNIANGTLNQRYDDLRNGRHVITVADTLRDEEVNDLEQFISTKAIAGNGHLIRNFKNLALLPASASTTPTPAVVPSGPPTRTTPTTPTPTASSTPPPSGATPGPGRKAVGWVTRKVSARANKGL